MSDQSKSHPDLSGATVYVVDDDDSVRAYLTWLMESVGIRVEAFESAATFLAAHDPKRPGCLLVDVRMPELSGFDVQAALVERGMRLPIMMMTGYAEVPMAVRAMRAGAVDFFQKPIDGQALLDRVRHVLADELVRSSSEESRDAARQRLGKLTQRQRAVLDAVLEGKASKVIAGELGLSPKTVDVHRSHIMERLGVRSVPELVRLVLLARDHAAPE